MWDQNRVVIAVIVRRSPEVQVLDAVGGSDPGGGHANRHPDSEVYLESEER